VVCVRRSAAWNRIWISLCGCFVETTTPFVNGTRVGIRISHDGTIFAAQGTVVHARERAGMGIRFANLEARSLAILDDWITETENRDDRQGTGVTGSMDFRHWKH
jgi:PilZ domain